MARKGLGRGLDVLIGSAAAVEGQRLEEINVSEIRPNGRQPRKSFDDESIEQMARSIESFGVVQPVVVRPVGAGYELIAGERRWRAAQRAGLDKIPAVIRESTETSSLEMALIENLHRSDLNGIEEAEAYQQLLEDFGITHEELSQRIGRSRAAISNSLRLLQLPLKMQKALIEGQISTGHARALLAWQDRAEEQELILGRVLAEALSVRQTEDLARAWTAPAPGEQPRAPRERPPLPEEVQLEVMKIAEILGTRVKGSLGKRKGRLVIEFHDVEDLKRISSIFIIEVKGTPADTGLA